MKKIFISLNFRTVSILSVVLFSSICSNAQRLGQKDSLTKFKNPTRETYYKDGCKLDKKTNRILKLYNINYEVSEKEPFKMGLQYLEHNYNKIGIEKDELKNLKQHSSRENPNDYVIKYQQMYKGIPVGSNTINIVIRKNGKVKMITNNYKKIEKELSVKPKISDSAARKIASKYFKSENSLIINSSLIISLLNDSNEYLAYKIAIKPKNFVGVWKVFISAESGEIIEAYDNSNYYEGTGKVFRPDPLSSARVKYPGINYGSSGFIDNSDANSNELQNELKDIDLHGIEYANNLYTLKGTLAEISDHEEPYTGIFTQSTSAFNFNRNQDGFEAVMCYYYIHMSMWYVNNTLGISVAPTQYSGGVLFDPHGCQGSPNATYDDATGKLAFGDADPPGTLNTDLAEDASVINHELGHGLHNWLTGEDINDNPATRNLSEGIADYWGQSYRRSLNLSNLDDGEFYHTISPWGQNVNNYGYRNTNWPIPDPAPENNAYIGSQFSTAMMRINEDLGRLRTDKLLLTGISYLDHVSTMDDAAQMVFLAAINLAYSENDLCIIWQNFNSIGFNMGAFTEPFPFNSDPDVYIRDTPLDFGIETNPDQGPMSVSQDIWVRHNDDDKFTHQNPLYSSGNPNYIYIRVRGNSCEPVNDAVLKVYWSKASTGLEWPNNWINYYVTTHAGNVLAGNQVGSSISIPQLEAGEEIIIKVPWYIPHPNNFNQDKHHYCILARIESSTDPIGTEDERIHYNVKNNNNIALKNVEIYYVDNNPPRMYGLYTRNITNQSKILDFKIDAVHELDRPKYYDAGKLTLTLDSALSAHWITGGYEGNNIYYSVDVNNIVTIEPIDENAYFGNITFAAFENAGIVVQFLDDTTVDNVPFSVDITQMDGEEPVGTERYFFTYEEEDLDTSQPEPFTQNLSVLKYRESKEIKLYPNPFTSIINAEVFTTKKESVYFELYSITGVLTNEVNYPLMIGINKLQLSFTNEIPEGIYFLKSKFKNGEIKTSKIIKY